MDVATAKGDTIIETGLCLGVGGKIFAVIKIARTRAGRGRASDWLSTENERREGWDGSPGWSGCGGINSNRVEDCRRKINRRERGGRWDETGDG